MLSHAFLHTLSQVLVLKNIQKCVIITIIVVVITELHYFLFTFYVPVVVVMFILLVQQFELSVEYEYKPTAINPFSQTEFS